MIVKDFNEMNIK